MKEELVSSYGDSKKTLDQKSINYKKTTLTVC